MQVYFHLAGRYPLQGLWMHPQRQGLWSRFESLFMLLKTSFRIWGYSDIDDRAALGTYAIDIPMASVIRVGLYQTAFVPLHVLASSHFLIPHKQTEPYQA